MMTKANKGEKTCQGVQLCNSSLAPEISWGLIPVGATFASSWG